MGYIKRKLNSLKERKRNQEWTDNWRRANTHNFTTISRIELPESKTISDIVKVGKGTYGHIDLSWFWNENEYLQIGNYCSIAGGVKFLTGGNHYLDRLSSYPFAFYNNLNEKYITPTKGPIIVKDDVWIGVDSIILSGVTIGQGAVIGAGSVVAKNVPPYAVWVGNQVVKYRFSEDIIKKLLQFDYSSLESDDIINNADLLNTTLDSAFFESDFYKMHRKTESDGLEDRGI